MNIASRFKQARKARGYTQDALASSIEVSRGVISNIEYEKSEPQALVLRAICDVLRIDEHWLVSGEGQMEGDTEQGKSARLHKASGPLLEIYDCAKELSEEEQDTILDMIRTYQKHRKNIGEGQYP